MCGGQAYTKMQTGVITQDSPFSCWKHVSNNIFKMCVCV